MAARILLSAASDLPCASASQAAFGGFVELPDIFQGFIRFSQT